MMDEEGYDLDFNNNCTMVTCDKDRNLPCDFLPKRGKLQSWTKQGPAKRPEYVLQIEGQQIVWGTI